MQHGNAYLEDGWFLVPWQVIFRDLDAFGHVNNATFFTYFEWGRARLWFSLTGGGVASDIGFIVARAASPASLETRRRDIKSAA